MKHAAWLTRLIKAVAIAFGSTFQAFRNGSGTSKPPAEIENEGSDRYWSAKQ